MRRRWSQGVAQPPGLIERRGLGAVFALTRRIAGILGVQAAIQATNMLIGLLILRELAIGDYAAYTIAGTIIGLGTALAGLSLYPAASFQVVRAGGDVARVGRIAGTAARLQHALLVPALGVSVVVAFGYRHQFDGDRQLILALAAILLSILLGARLELARSFFYARQNARPVLIADGAIALLRALLIPPLLFLAPGVGVVPVLLINGLAQAVGFVRLRLPPRPVPGPVDRDTLRQLLRFMMPIWPENIYYLVQGSVAVLILGWVGSSHDVAELGALSRLVQIVMILAILNRFIVQPYAAGYRSRADFRARAARVMAVYAAASVVIISVAITLPEPFVLILGEQYRHLTPYVLPAMALALLTLGGAVLYWLCLASGRTGGLSLTIPANLSIQIAYLATVGATTVPTALGFLLVTAASEFVVRLALLAWLAWRSSLPAVEAAEPRSDGEP